MDFAALIAPIPLERFRDEYYGNRPLHVPAADANRATRHSLLDWERLNDLLAQRPHWTPNNLKLIMNSRAVAVEHYTDEVLTGLGPALRRADPAKVHQFLAMGASLVADALEEVDPTIAQAVAMLGSTFAGKSGANAYCSFEGVQAFASHCDMHDVFAVHLHGKKVWRIYENRADAPIRPLSGDGAQAMIDRAKGRILMEVAMEPGDLLYLPRGFFHDAMAASDISLHLTFALLPMTGIAALRMLVQQAEEDAAFRAYLPDARESGGSAMGERLQGLAARLAGILSSPLFLADVAAYQRALATRPYRPDLPARPKLSFYAATGRPAEVVRRLAGAVLRHATGEAPLGPLSGPAQWALEQEAFSLQQLAARFPWMTSEEGEGLVALMVRADLVFFYKPEL